jgi:DNA-binding protein HU-beta
MNKSELIAAVVERADTSKAEAGRILDAVLAEIQKSLADGDEVAVTGFGKFSVSKRAARQGRNPRTGAAVQIPASKAPRFSAGAGLKAAVNGR